MASTVDLPTQPHSIWLKAGQAPPAWSSTFKLWTWLKAQVDITLYRPQATPGVIARRLREDDVTYYVLKNPNQNAYLKLSESDYAVWQWMDGSRTVKDLVLAYFEQFKSLAFGRITSLVDELKANGFLVDKPVGVFQQVSEQLARRDWTYRWKQLARAFLQYEFEINGLDRWISALYSKGGWLLFTPVVQVLFILLALAGLVAFITALTAQHYTIVATSGSYWLGLFLLWVANSVVIFIHEHAHALATKHFRREIRRGGFLIYYGMPAFFVDTMDIWLEPKLRRIAVTWAGPYSGLVLGGVCSLATLLLPVGLIGQVAFKVAFVCYIGVLVNLNPLLELDGYFILIDWLGIPNLRERSFAFIRAELWPKLKKAFESRTAVPGSKPDAAPVFDREETIFATFGLLAAAYTLYTLVVAVYFWQTRFSVMLVELWNRPSWIAKLGSVIFGAGVIVPVGLVVGVTAWSTGRKVWAYLDRRHFFESNRNLTLVLLISLALVMSVPIRMGELTWQLYASLSPIALMGVAALMLAQVVRQHVGARFQLTFWALAFSASLLLGGSLLRGAFALGINPTASRVSVMLGFEQFAALALLVVSFQSLLEVDLRHSSLWERMMVMGILALSFVAVIPVARWTASKSWWVIALSAAGPYCTLIFIAAIIPTLATYYRTRFFAPWLVLVTAAALNGALCVARLSPTWPLMSDMDLWLALLVAGLWAMGSLGYVLAGLRLRPEAAHWSEDLLLSDNERLQVGFARFFAALFDAFRAMHGERRAKAVDDDLDVISVATDWDVEIDSGRINDELDLSQTTILEQADRYRDVLGRTIDLMDDWAGSAFIARATQSAYDSLPWPERETLGQYVLAGSPWGSAIAAEFDDARSGLYHILQQVPLLASCNNRALDLIMAAVQSECVPAGTVLGRQEHDVTRFVIVQSGAVEKWVRSTDKAPAKLVGTLRRGASLGSEAFMGGGAYTGTYRTAIPTEILYLSLEECNNLMRAGVKLATEVGQVLAIRQLLGRMPLFASMGPQQLDALAHKIGRQAVAAGQDIIRQGEERHHFYIIASGLVEVRVAAERDEQEQMVAQLGPGQHFGETALYSDEPYSATCRAVTPTTLLTLDEATFDEMVGSSLQMTHYVEQVSSGRTIDTRRKLGLTGVM